jgi:hypothetical protein
VVLFRLRPGRERVAPVHLPGYLAEGFLRRCEFAFGDGQQPFDRDGDPFLEAQFLLELVAAKPEGRARLGRHFLLEVLDVGADRVRRFLLCVGEIAEQVQIVDAGERAWQILVDELQRAFHRLDADLDEDAGRFLDVVAGRLDETRRLAQLRQDAACAFRRGRVSEQRLAGQARRQDIGVHLRVTLPVADGFEVEHPAAQVRSEHAVFESLDGGQPVAIDLLETTKVSRERACFLIDPVAAQVLEQIVVRVHAVEGGMRGMRFVEVPKEVVDKMRKRFGNGHGSLLQRGFLPLGAPATAAEAIRQWYNKGSLKWPVRCSWSPRQSATSKIFPPAR